jgi:hypothetical protein
MICSTHIYRQQFRFVFDHWAWFTIVDLTLAAVFCGGQANNGIDRIYRVGVGAVWAVFSGEL